ncbi:peptidase S8/S53 domain-containing protein [Lasiosphaeria hispida]|uniref:Peptidase S8/S53 domain-containing protein n=1 Tax=Lasiosphaeria hispida TaxID=260671 RepID=A0AAJ0ML89_9PEZI|nr:peptidase S8/S53 domain-containing protein [Lasiosphaeria hispida]
MNSTKPTPSPYAIDSGVSFQGKMNSYKHRIKRRQDFTTTTNPKELCLDTNGHGTAVVYQLIKTCPDAEIYVAKVVQERHGDSADVEHAAKPRKDKGWGVDIISMSFGWDHADPTSIWEAMKYAADQHILLFAAATNYGLGEKNDILYPARDARVISVDTQNGYGKPAPFATQSASGHTVNRFCAPGLGAANPLGVGALSGSSFACPVVAGIAALVLQFTRQEPLNHCLSVTRAVTNHQGMMRVLRDTMSKSGSGQEVFKILYPWNLFKLDLDTNMEDARAHAVKAM